jgi:hypothetical protein
MHPPIPRRAIRSAFTGYECQGRSRAVDIVLHRRRSAHPDRPDKFAVHLDGKPSPVRRHTRQRGDAGPERRVALDEVEEVLRGHAEERRVRFVLRNLDAQNVPSCGAGRTSRAACRSPTQSERTTRYAVRAAAPSFGTSPQGLTTESRWRCPRKSRAPCGMLRCRTPQWPGRSAMA